MSDRNISRRSILRTSAALTTGLGGISRAAGGVATDPSESSPEYRQIPTLDLSDAEFRTESSSTPTPERATGIRPGSQMFIHFPDGGTAGCTANFIWREGGGGPPAGAGGKGPQGGHGNETLYIGAAGHCFLPGDKNASRNARRPGESKDDLYDVSQLKVEVCKTCTVGGGTGFFVVHGERIELGEVAYARQNLPNGDAVGHDFGIVEIPDKKKDQVVRSLPQWGGPHGVSNQAVPVGEPVHQYGAGVGNGEVYPTMGSSGVSHGDRGTPESWVASIRASPGDSGSPLVSSTAPEEQPQGDDAAGVLTHLVLSTDPLGNGTAGTTIGRCEEMAWEDANIDLSVELA